MNNPVESFQGRPAVLQQAGLTVTRVGANLGADITGVDLSKPISDEVRDAIENSLVENELIIFVEPWRGELAIGWDYALPMKKKLSSTISPLRTV